MGHCHEIFEERVGAKQDPFLDLKFYWVPFKFEWMIQHLSRASPVVMGTNLIKIASLSMVTLTTPAVKLF